ncbi:CDP-alcohol phosphatidyltransferase family protein [Pantoea allii]|uniref:CDP-alcohol phosphatidyltransferase family protein n=1 Tax=Pantoea allii TaxID=574096 RepID=UPI003D7B5218
MGINIFLYSNAANFISFLRLLICLSMLLLNKQNYYTFLIFYFSFWPMDSVDGYVSRKLHISSKLGGTIDLAVDRILDCTAALFVVALNKDILAISAAFMILRIVPNCIGIDFEADKSPALSSFYSYKLSKSSLRFMQEIYQGVRGFFFSSTIFLDNSYYSEYPFLLFTFIYFMHFFIRTLDRISS